MLNGYAGVDDDGGDDSSFGIVTVSFLLAVVVVVVSTQPIFLLRTLLLDVLSRKAIGEAPQPAVHGDVL